MMTADDFIKNMDEFGYIFDINHIPLHDPSYWEELYDADIVTVSILCKMAMSRFRCDRFDYCTLDSAKFLYSLYEEYYSNVDIFDYLYNLALRIINNEYKRIGYLTHLEFVEKLREWPEIYNLEKPFDESHYTKDDDPYYISRKYRIHFGVPPEYARQKILILKDKEYISPHNEDFLWVYDFCWPAFLPKDERPIANCFDLAYKALTRFFEDEGRRR